MHGGRKSPLARAFREHAAAERSQARDAPSLGFDERLETLHDPGVSRRDVLRAAGVLGAGWALASCTPGRGDPSTSAAAGGPTPSPHDARVVVVGAGLAGVTAAYRLTGAGVPVRLFEARDRLGGRCWSSRGWADGQIAEHGGEFIDTRHVHIRQLSRQLGLRLDDLWTGTSVGSYAPRWVRGRDLTVHETKPVMAEITSAAERTAMRLGVLKVDGSTTLDPISYPTATEAAKALDQETMSEWLEAAVPGVVRSRVGQWLDESMAGWYGLNMDQLSALNWMDYLVVPAPGADERYHVRGGNDQIITRAVDAMPADTVRLDAPLRALARRSDGTYDLEFDGVGGPVRADIVILTMPMSTLRQVDLTKAGFGAQTTAGIQDLAMGFDVKLLVQYDRRPKQMGDWSSYLEYADPDFDTWESSLTEPGTAGLITVYAGGRTGASWTADMAHGPAPRPLVDDILGRIDEAVPGSRDHFNGRAWTDLWTRDPWTNGAYAAFAPGQYTRFWGGLGQADGNVHLAGEATSTYSQGYLNGGVESGDRVAEEVLRKLGVAVPGWLSRLPH
jgi:monoamine oxidase